MKKRKLLIDSNVLINNYSNCKDRELSGPKDGVLDFIQEINLNYEIWIFTTREPELIRKWLIKYGFDKYIKKVTNKKEPAMFISIMGT